MLVKQIIRLLLITFSIQFNPNAYATYYKKLFKIQDYNIDDLYFEVSIEGLKKNLKSYYPLRNLDKFKIGVYWIKSGALDIVLKKLPKGKKRIEGEIKIKVLEKLKIFFPKNEIKNLSKKYSVIKEKGRFVAENKKRYLRKIIFDLNKNNLIWKINLFYNLNKINREIYYSANSGENKKFKIIEMKEKHSKYKDLFSKDEKIIYKKQNEFLLPQKIKVTERVLLKGPNEKKINSGKKYSEFSYEFKFINYEVNKGVSKKHFKKME